MREIEDLVAEYADLSARAEESLEGKPAKFMAGLVAAQRDARAKLGEVKARYTAYVKDAAFGLFLAGSATACAEFARVAQEQADTITVRADRAYEALSEDVEPTIGARREFGVTQLRVLVRALTDLCKDYDLQNVPIPALSDTLLVPERPDVVAAVRGLVRGVLGDRLALLDLEAQVLKAATAAKCSKSVVPVVVLGLGPEREALQSELFSGRNFTVKVSGPVTEETVLKALQGVKDRLKKQLK